MNVMNVTKVIERVESIPTLPHIVTELMQIIGNPHSSASDVSKILSGDQALTSKILRLANSAYYGFPQKISTVKHATAILGFNTVKSVALSIAVFDFFKHSRGNFNRREFWIHSLGTAVIANLLARTINLSDPEKSFVAGLLHDIGKVILDEYLHDEFVAIIEAVQYKSISVLEAETQMLGVGHDLVGERVAERWNLPKVLRTGIRNHHTSPLALPAQSLHREVAGIVYLANILCKRKKIGSGGDSVIPDLDARAWSALGIKEERTDWLLSQIDGEITKAKEFFNILVK